MINLVIAVAAWWTIMMPGSSADDLVPGYWEQTPLPQTGVVTYYNPGIMDIVREYRDKHGQLPDCPECVGSAALLRGGDIGRKVWLELADGQLIGPVMVADCAHPKHIPALLAKGWVVDVDYELGMSLGVNRPLPVTVWDNPDDATAHQEGRIAPATATAVPSDAGWSAATPSASATASPPPTPQPEPLSLAPVRPDEGEVEALTQRSEAGEGVESQPLAAARWARPSTLRLQPAP